MASSSCIPSFQRCVPSTAVPPPPPPLVGVPWWLRRRATRSNGCGWPTMEYITQPTAHTSTWREHRITATTNARHQYRYRIGSVVYRTNATNQKKKKLIECDSSCRATTFKATFFLAVRDQYQCQSQCVCLCRCKRKCKCFAPMHMRMGMLIQNAHLHKANTIAKGPTTFVINSIWCCCSFRCSNSFCSRCCTSATFFSAAPGDSVIGSNRPAIGRSW